MAGEDGPNFPQVSGVVVQEDTAVQSCRRLKLVVVVVGQHRTGVASQQCPAALQRHF